MGLLSMARSKDLIKEIEKLATPTVRIERGEFGKRISEFCTLYKSIFNLAKNPDCKIAATYAGRYVYVDRLHYLDFLKDLGLLRYKFSRKKYKSGGKRA